MHFGSSGSVKYGVSHLLAAASIPPSFPIMDQVRGLRLADLSSSTAPLCIISLHGLVLRGSGRPSSLSAKTLC